MGSGGGACVAADPLAHAPLGHRGLLASRRRPGAASSRRRNPRAHAGRTLRRRARSARRGDGRVARRSSPTCRAPHPVRLVRGSGGSVRAPAVARRAERQRALRPRPLPRERRGPPGRGGRKPDRGVPRSDLRDAAPPPRASSRAAPGDRRTTAGRELSLAATLLGHEEEERIHLFGGGFGRDGLLAALPGSELRRCSGEVP